MKKSLDSLNQSLPSLLDPKLIEAEICRRSYYEFFKRAWHVLEPTTPFEDNWHIKYLCDRLQSESERIARREPKIKDLIINIPPRSLKSMIVTVMWNAWAWIENPNISFITASYSGELATEHAVKTRNLIESEWYTQRFNATDRSSFSMAKDQNAKSRFENNKKGSRRATSVGGTVTGGGADILIADDPLKVQDAYSALARQTAIDWWSKTMFSRINDQRIGLKIVVMQRLHEDDLTGYLLSTNANYELISLPADCSEGEPQPSSLKENYIDNLFSPNRFSKAFLSDAKVSLGSRDYAGQYVQTPSPVEGDIIKESWFKWIKLDQVPTGLIRHTYSDTAYGKEKSDNSATLVYSINSENNNVYCYASHAWNVPFPEFITKFLSLASASEIGVSSKCYFEPKATGVSVVQQLQRSTTLNVLEDEPPKDSKESRVSAVAPVIEAGKVFLVEGGAGLDELVAEAIVFPSGKHDDRLDTLVGAIQLSQRNNFVFVKNY